MTEVKDYSTLKVGDKLTVWIRDEVGTARDLIDSNAEIVSIREDGTPMIDCPQYSKYDSKGSGENTQVLPLDHFENWRLETTAQQPVDEGNPS